MGLFEKLYDFLIKAKPKEKDAVIANAEKDITNKIESEIQNNVIISINHPDSALISIKRFF